MDLRDQEIDENESLYIINCTASVVLISLTALHLPHFKMLSFGESGSYWNSEKSWLKSHSVPLVTNRISSGIQQPDPIVWDSRLIRPGWFCSVK